MEMVMTNAQKKQAIKDWTADVFDRDSEIDPHHEYDWEGIALGYFIGKGFGSKDARKLTTALEKRGKI
jgi:hypothetical protein